ncbi:MAG: MarC family protein [Phycisphaeraceae bacterium JB051]
MLSQFINTYLKLFFILTPFVALTSFLTWSRDCSKAERFAIIRRVMIAIVVISAILLTCGDYLFAVMGITLDAFRIGAGILLLLSAISLVQGKEFYDLQKGTQDIAVVPLAIPVIVGPGTIGVLMVMGSELRTFEDRAIGYSALLAAIMTLGILLSIGDTLEKKLGRKGINVMSKLTGLILSALAVQIIMQGLQHFQVIG